MLLMSALWAPPLLTLHSLRDPYRVVLTVYSTSLAANALVLMAGAAQWSTSLTGTLAHSERTIDLCSPQDSTRFSTKLSAPYCLLWHARQASLQPASDILVGSTSTSSESCSGISLCGLLSALYHPRPRWWRTERCKSPDHPISSKKLVLTESSTPSATQPAFLGAFPAQANRPPTLK